MVFFNCNSCGEALKKNQVEKHYQFKCRDCNVLSCVDCQKEFWGDAYKEHTKCISEEEKYSGKNWKPKANANKGEQKQEAWTQQVITAISKCPAGKQNLKDLLLRIQDYPNIPRKKAKFDNFVKNSMRVREVHLIAEAWNIINSEAQQADKSSGDPKENGHSNGQQPEIQATGDPGEHAQVNGDSEVKKLSKRERKEERQKKQQKPDKKKKHKKSEESQQAENGDDNAEVADSEKVSKKRGKKRQREEHEDTEDSPEQTEDTKLKKKKKKKKTQDENEEGLNGDMSVLEQQEVEPRRKFSWEGAILEILQKATDQEISLKKMKKKILAEFHSGGGDGKAYTEEKLMSKLNKHILNNPRLKIHKERIHLIS